MYALGVVNFSASDTNYVQKHNHNYGQFRDYTNRFLREYHHQYEHRWYDGVLRRAGTYGDPLGYVSLNESGQVPARQLGVLREFVPKSYDWGGSEPGPVVATNWNQACPPMSIDSGALPYGEFFQRYLGEAGWTFPTLEGPVENEVVTLQQVNFDPTVVVRTDYLDSWRGNAPSPLSGRYTHDGCPLIHDNGQVDPQFVPYPDWDAYELRSRKDQPEGYSGLDANGKVPMTNIDVAALGAALGL